MAYSYDLLNDSTLEARIRMAYQIIRRNDACVELWVSSQISDSMIKQKIQDLELRPSETVIVYRSGHIPLVSATQALLENNRSS